MAAGYDGSIRIDTRIDTNGFNAGTKNITRGLNGITASLGKLAVAAGLAYLTAQMVGFGKASIKAATDFENAMIGVRSIVDGQGRSFAEAKRFIQDYISDGLVPATNAANAYKNLAMRGYDDEQIKTTMIALKNSAAFGRQASLSMGEAVQGATEGLKNENSILVDNAGVTKNVSMMWKDYADSIGVGVNSLTKQQKIQAEVVGIMEETRFQMGDAAKIAGTYSGQVMMLAFNFNNLKIAVGNALIPIAQAVLPSINAIMVALTRLANLFAQVTAAIFGKQASAQKDVAVTGVAAQKSQNALAKATKGVGDASKKTNKELKSSLANFDELNVLAKSTAESMEDAAGAGVDVPEVAAGTADVQIEVPDSPFFNKLQADIEGLRQAMANLWTWIGNTFGKPLKLMFTEGWDKIVKPAVEIIKKMGADMVEAFQNVWKDFGKPIAEGFKKLFENIGIVIAQAWEFWKPLIQKGWEALNYIWDNGGKQVFEQMVELVANITLLVLNIVNMFMKLIQFFQKEFAPDLKIFFGNAIEDFKGFSSGVLLAVLLILDSLNGMLGFINGVFATDWKKVWESLKLTVTTVFIGIGLAIKNQINSIIDYINRLIKGMNGIKFTAPVWVPGVGGKSWGASIPTIPRLATGAVIPPNGEFLAVLGDQRNGRNLEAPEDLIRKIVREEGGNNGLLSVLQDIHAAIREGKVLVVDKQVLGKVVNKAQSESFRAAGTTLVPV